MPETNPQQTKVRAKDFLERLHSVVIPKTTINIPWGNSSTRTLTVEYDSGWVFIYDEDELIFNISDPKHLGSGWFAPGFMYYTEPKDEAHISLAQERYKEIFGEYCDDIDEDLYKKVYGQGMGLSSYARNKFTEGVDAIGGTGEMPDFGAMSKESITLYGLELKRKRPDLDNLFIQDLMTLPDAMDHYSKTGEMLSSDIQIAGLIFRRFTYATLLKKKYDNFTDAGKSITCSYSKNDLTLQNMPDHLFTDIKNKLGCK